MLFHMLIINCVCSCVCVCTCGIYKCRPVGSEEKGRKGLTIFCSSGNRTHLSTTSQEAPANAESSLDLDVKFQEREIWVM